MLEKVGKQFRNWWSTSFKAKRRAPLATNRRRLWLERLEDRTLMSLSITGDPIWTEQGPRPIRPASNDGSWAGAVESIAVHPNNPLDPAAGYVVYAGSVNGGVWRTDNIDASDPTNIHWRALTDQEPSLAVSALALSPLDNSGRTLFVATGSVSSAGDGGRPVGLLLTNDGGATWSVLARASIGNWRVLSIVPTSIIDPGTGQQVVLIAAIDGGGLLRSENGGNSFHTVNNLDTGSTLYGNATDLIADPNNPNRFFAALPGVGIFSSDDGGANWTRIDSGIAAAGGDIASAQHVKLAVHADGTGTTLYAAVSGTPTAKWRLQGVYRAVVSGNGQPTWSSIDLTGYDLANKAFDWDNNGSFGGRFSFAADPTNANLVYIGGVGGGIWRGDASPSSSARWALLQVNGARPHSDSRSLTFLAGSETLLETDDGGTWRLTDAGSWQPSSPNYWDDANGDLGITEFYHVAYDESKHAILGGAQDVASSIQTGPGQLQWILPPNAGGDGSWVAADATGTDYYYTDGGGTPTLYRNGTAVQLNGIDPQDQVVAPFSINSANSKRLLIGWNSVYESFDQGDNLKKVPAPGMSGTVTDLVYGVSDPDAAYMTTSSGQLFFSPFLDFLNIPLTEMIHPWAQGVSARQIVVDPNNVRIAYVVDTSNHIWRTTDNGATSANWADITGDLSSTASNLPSGIMDMRCLELANGVLLAGGLGGVFRLLEPAQGPYHWTQYGDRPGGTLPNVLVTSLLYDSVDDVLVAGTLGRGAWAVNNASATVTASEILQINDHIVRISLDATNRSLLDVFLNNDAQPDYQIRLAQLQGIQVSGSATDNTLIIDDTNGLISVPDISYDAGSGSNTLQVLNDNDPNSENVAIGQSQITGLGPGAIQYQNVAFLQVNAGSGGNTITLSPTAHNLDELPHSEILGLFSYQGSVTVNGGGADTLILDDQNQTNASTWTVTGGSVTRSYYPGLLEQVSAIVNYSRIANLVLNAGSGGNTITLSPTAQNLDELPHSSTILGFTSVGSVTVNGGGADTLVLDDQNNSNASTWTAAGNNVTRSYTTVVGGFVPETITSSVNYSGIANLVLNAGSGGNTITLSQNAHNLDELPHTHTIGLFTRQGSVTVHGGGSDTLILDDQQNTQPSTWLATGSAVTRSYTTGGALFETVSAIVNYSELASLTLNGGTGGNTFNVQSTAAGTPVTINSAGPDAVNVGNSTDGVGDIQGSLSITNNPTAGDYTALTVDDSAYRRGYWQSRLTNSSLTTFGRSDNGNQVTVAPINFRQSDLRSLRVLLGNSPGAPSGNIVVIADTPSSTFSGGMMTTITTGTGSAGANDAIYVSATTGPLTVNLNNDGQHPASSVIVGAGSRTLDNIHGAITVNSLSGWTDVELNDSANPNPHTYTVTKSTVAFRPNLPVVTYHVTNALFLYAGFGINTINVASTAPATVVNAGLSGKDTINIGDGSNTLNGISLGYLSIQIDNPGNRVILNDQGDPASRNYRFTNPDSTQSVIFRTDSAWNQLEQIYYDGPLQSLALNGSRGSDTFQFQALPAPSPTKVVVKGGGGTDILVGPNTTNNWVVSGSNSGSLDQRVSFSAVQNLVGGTGVDVFKLTPAGKISSINGGGAPAGMGDWLDYSAWTTPVTVNLATGSASNVNGGAAGAVANIQDVHGGNGGNTLTGNSQGNILIGGAGADTIVGGTGRSLLIGDNGADHIAGGSGGSASGGDILIGGTTIWDSDSNAHFQALMSILAEWQSGNSYATRVSHLRLGGGLNGSNKLIWGTTVKDDGAANVLTAATAGPGTPAVDWFFTGMLDTAVNTETGEAHNNGSF